eukprot:TRINITY_DN2465_c0_g1_i1.p1 TRINITY_DN2465_c0_g1~~TRINITY_DN2465_c0_g1_i1.p1  ORF type:complete len:769 (+),score=249.20 TRINITY_DN2465_c0_g1_i1:34-2307(+)
MSENIRLNEYSEDENDNLISILDFDYEDPKATLPKSPRSLEAAFRLGYDFQDLKFVPFESFMKKNPGKFSKHDYEILYEHFNERRIYKLNSIQEKYNELCCADDIQFTHLFDGNNCEDDNINILFNENEIATSIAKEQYRLEKIRRKQEHDMNQMMKYEIEQARKAAEWKAKEDEARTKEIEKQRDLEEKKRIAAREQFFQKQMELKRLEEERKRQHREQQLQYEHEQQILNEANRKKLEEQKKKRKESKLRMQQAEERRQHVENMRLKETKELEKKLKEMKKVEENREREMEERRNAKRHELEMQAHLHQQRMEENKRREIARNKALEAKYEDKQREAEERQIEFKLKKELELKQKHDENKEKEERRRAAIERAKLFDKERLEKIMEKQMETDRRLESLREKERVMMHEKAIISIRKQKESEERCHRVHEEEEKERMKFMKEQEEKQKRYDEQRSTLLESRANTLLQHKIKEMDVNDNINRMLKEEEAKKAQLLMKQKKREQVALMMQKNKEIVLKERKKLAHKSYLEKEKFNDSLNKSTRKSFNLTINSTSSSPKTEYSSSDYRSPYAYRSSTKVKSSRSSQSSRSSLKSQKKTVSSSYDTPSNGNKNMEFTSSTDSFRKRESRDTEFFNDEPQIETISHPRSQVKDSGFEKLSSEKIVAKPKLKNKYDYVPSTKESKRDKIRSTIERHTKEMSSLIQKHQLNEQERNKLMTEVENENEQKRLVKIFESQKRIESNQINSLKSKQKRELDLVKFK